MILTHHGINSLSRVAVGDCLYADANGKKHFVNPDAIPSPLPAGWEFVGVVALVDGGKTTILYKTENTGVKWISMWLFKVEGLKLDGTDTFVLQQGPASGSTPVEVGTFTATSAATDLDTLVSELDTWLRANPTATGAFANYNWHAEKHADADGIDSCFIVVDNVSNQSRFTPIKSSTSGASSSLYLWNFTEFDTNSTQIRRKDGVLTSNVVCNKELFKSKNANVGTPSDSLTTTGLFGETSFNSTTVVKEHYGTYDNYLDHMIPDEDATVGAYFVFKGKGDEITESFNNVVFKNLSGTETHSFAAAHIAKSVTAHSTASVEGLNAGDFFVPSIDIIYKILSSLALDKSDPINTALEKAGYSTLAVGGNRFAAARYGTIDTYRATSDGVFSFANFTTSYTCMSVAEIKL